MQYRNTFTLKLGSLHACVFLASRLQRAHGTPAMAIYVQWRRRVLLQLPRRQNLAVPYGRDLPYSEVLRTWQGISVGDLGCDPNYKPRRTWEEIAADPTLSPNATRYAREQVQAQATASARRTTAGGTR